MIHPLLKPRFEVIAKWPRSGELKAGTILELCCVANIEGAFFHSDTLYLRYPDFSLYPHLFKELKWFEHRDKKEMPTYMLNVKYKSVFKIENWYKARADELIASGWQYIYQDIFGVEPLIESAQLPATEQDYLLYLQNENQAVKDASPFEQEICNHIYRRDRSKGLKCAMCGHPNPNPDLL